MTDADLGPKNRSPAYGCRRCGKRVPVVDGYLECCGHREPTSRVERVFNVKIFPEVVEIWDDEGNVEYEGIPNSD